MNFQRGVALITAIVLVAIATILAVHIGTRTALDLRRTAGLAALDQGWHVALGAEAWAAEVLNVEVPTNLVFFVSIVILFLVSLQHAGELTDLEDRTRTLAEEVALQRVKLERLEGASRSDDAEADSPD